MSGLTEGNKLGGCGAVKTNVPRDYEPDEHLDATEALKAAAEAVKELNLKDSNATRWHLTAHYHRTKRRTTLDMAIFSV